MDGNKRQKTGGRTRGSPNKNTLKFRELIENTKIDIAIEAVKLYQETENESIKLKILIFLAEYTYSKPKPIEDTNPEDESNTSDNLSESELLKVIK
jgi:hypothetical protein